MGGVIVEPAVVTGRAVDFTAHPHPSMAVGCPTCGAAAGAWCKRPSGHRAWGDFHKERHQVADREWYEGAYPVVIATEGGFAYGPSLTAGDLAVWRRARADYLREISPPTQLDLAFSSQGVPAK
jgi:hypothetical protein